MKIFSPHKTKMIVLYQRDTLMRKISLFLGDITGLLDDMS